MEEDDSRRFTVTFIEDVSRFPIDNSPVCQQYNFSPEGVALGFYATLLTFFQNGGRLMWESFARCPELFVLLAPIERIFHVDSTNCITVTTALHIGQSELLGRTELNDNEMLELSQNLSFLIFNQLFTQSNLVGPVVNLISTSILETPELAHKNGYCVSLTFRNNVQVLLKVFHPSRDSVQHETLIVKIFAKALVNFSFPGQLETKLLKHF